MQRERYGVSEIDQSQNPHRLPFSWHDDTEDTAWLIGVLTGLQSNAATILIAWEAGSVLPHMASGTY